MWERGEGSAEDQLKVSFVSLLSYASYLSVHEVGERNSIGRFALGIKPNDLVGQLEIHLANRRAKVLLGHVRASLGVGLQLLSSREVCLLELDAIRSGYGTKVPEAVGIKVRAGSFCLGGDSTRVLTEPTQLARQQPRTRVQRGGRWSSWPIQSWCKSGLQQVVKRERECVCERV